jgi:hypothetical protein
MTDPALTWMQQPWAGTPATQAMQAANPPLAPTIAIGGQPVVLFAPNTIVHCADIINPATMPAGVPADEVLYVDLVNPASPGQPTSIPLLPGQTYRVSAPIAGDVTAVAATAGHPIIAVAY